MKIKNIIVFVLFLCLDAVSFAQTPPSVVNNPNGTVSLVSGTINYTFDSKRKFRVATSCNNSTLNWGGANQNGTKVYMDSFVDVDFLITPLDSTILPVPANGFFYQVWRSADILFSWDASKFQLVGAVSSPQTDTAVVDVSKISTTLLAPGVLNLHSQCLPAPQNRVPAQNAQYFAWNFGGFVWANGSRNIGRLRFKVISDFYFPASPVQLTSMFALPTFTKIDGTLTKTKVDGGVVANDDVIEIRNSVNNIKSGPSPAYKVDLSLAGPVTQVTVGETFSVKLLVKPATIAQSVLFVSTLFAWDKTKLEFMGIDKVGAKASQVSEIDLVNPTAVNEAAIPKDGTAHHNWLTQLGNDSLGSAEFLVVTLKFKAVANFTETTVEVIKKSDPRLVGVSVLDDTGIGGSCVPGVSVTGVLKNAVVRGTGQ